MSAQNQPDLFQFMLERIKDVQKLHLDQEPQAFGRWFTNLYFNNPSDLFVSDGAKDGKIDLFCTTHNGKSVRHHVLNTKFTKEFSKIAPPSFYQEIRYFWHAFENKDSREAYLAKAVKAELRPKYKQLFERYDDGAAELMFVTNHRKNDAHYEQVRASSVRIFHLDDLIQFLVDDIDGAMPKTPSIRLEAIHGVLSPDKKDTEVATSIVFARLLDFIRYMQGDPYDLLFNRNVRVAISVSQSDVNRAIQETFKTSPKEFAFSNNGITMLCEKQHYDPAQKILTLDNPRIVNGSQTLHSIRDVPNPSPSARVMVRIVEIEPPRGDSLDEKIQRRKEVINKIAVRSNQQNPIKSWDLASNDNFQLDIFRFFRSKGLFYERKTREWGQRSRELKNLNVRFGSSIKWLTQLISSFNWAKAGLGPVVAKKVADLFEGEVYDRIQQTSPELAFQIYVLDCNLWECRSELAKGKVYIQSLSTHVYFALFSLVIRALTEQGAKWGNVSLTEQLQAQWPDWNPHYQKKWKALTKACIDHIYAAYKRDSIQHRGAEKKELTYANYFKNQSYITPILKGPISKDIKDCSQAVLES